MAGGEHRVRVLDTLTTFGFDLDRLCAAHLAMLPQMSGASLAAMTALPARGTRYVSDAVIAHIEELQFALGEGPCVDAFTDGRPTLAADLAARQNSLRWPAFAPAAVSSGARAVFAFPLRLGPIRLGVLGFYRDRPGALDTDEFASARVLADSAALLLVLERQAAPADWQEEVEYDAQTLINQATGMIMAFLGGTAEDALARLRARAYAEARSLDDIAADVVSRRLRFEDLRD